MGFQNDTLLDPEVTLFDIQISPLFWDTFWRNFGAQKEPNLGPGESHLTAHLPLGGLLGVQVGLHVTHWVLRVPTWTVWRSFWLIRGLFLGDVGFQNDTCLKPEVLLLTSKVGPCFGTRFEVWEKMTPNNYPQWGLGKHFRQNCCPLAASWASMWS